MPGTRSPARASETRRAALPARRRPAPRSRRCGDRWWDGQWRGAPGPARWSGRGSAGSGARCAWLLDARNRAELLLPCRGAPRVRFLADFRPRGKGNRRKRIADELLVGGAHRHLLERVLLNRRAGLLADIAAHRVVEQLLRVRPD